MYDICEIIKRLILRGNYDPEDIRRKLDVYYCYNRITEEQHQEIYELLQESEGLE